MHQHLIQEVGRPMKRGVFALLALIFAGLQAPPLAYVSGQPISGDGKAVKPGSVIAWQVKIAGVKILHPAVFVGPGNAKLREITNRPDLDNKKCYGIHFTPGSPSHAFFSVSTSGRNIKCGVVIEDVDSIWKRNSETAFEVIDHNDYTAFSDDHVVMRAARHLGSDFGGYEMQGNNCQCFALWALYGKREMLTADALRKTTARHVLCTVGMAAAGIAGFPCLAVTILAGAGVNMYIS
ncbi:unnamed protein product [Polarella glacialis]|uniref:LRAT domain-containing protein n=1 Tax=Polarella glacialis TaxID=89957 RepID=A0A813IIC6_POLGL|nr:unnamed protein product [Polarella glacialis]